MTFRLADSLPKAVLLKIQAERAERLQRFHAEEASAKKLGATSPKTEALEQIERDYFRKLEAYLDKGTGACWLGRPEIAEIVAKPFRFFDSERYRLDAWVVMPNHVHAVVWPMASHTLSEILHSWKSYTSKEANKLLRRAGETFWQTESFDHWVRDDAEQARLVAYVQTNPVKAGFCKRPEDWKWSSAFGRARQ